MSKLVEETTKNNTIQFDEFSEEGNYKYSIGRGKEYRYNKNGGNRSNYWKLIIYILKKLEFNDDPIKENNRQKDVTMTID